LDYLLKVKMFKFINFMGTTKAFTLFRKRIKEQERGDSHVK